MTLDTLPLQSAIMFAVAAVAVLGGAWLIVQLRHPQGPARVYVYRMVGIMALSLGVVLALSAAAMWRWSVEIP